MHIAVKVLLALVGLGMGCGVVLWLGSSAAKRIKHLGFYLQVGVFLLAFAVVIDASFGRIGPDGRGDSPIFVLFWWGLIGFLVTGLVRLVRSWFK